MFKMVHTSAWCVLFSVFLFLCAECLPFRNEMYNDALYNELRQLYLTCDGLDSCRVFRSSDDLSYFNCDCGRECARLGTCCADAEFRSMSSDSSDVSCVLPYKTADPSLAMYMVDSCRPDLDVDDYARDMCYADGEVLNDPMLLVPVTNKFTGETYKNYFCFACNSNAVDDELVFWDFILIGNSWSTSNISLSSLNYNKELRKWVLQDRNASAEFHVLLPKQARDMVKVCPLNIIRRCAVGWDDATTAEKCGAYMAMVSATLHDHVYHFYNPHCAICNFVDVADIKCKIRTLKDDYEYKPKDYYPYYGNLFMDLFTWGDKVKRCPRGKVYDKFADKCRTVRCGKSQKMVDGECRAS